ncbi:MAG: T9SS type A sorting domain-containing protein [Bacteroidota bacterium]
MKKVYLVIVLSIISIIGKTQNFEWSKRAGSWAYDYGNGIGTDNAGNMYVAGKYELNANFSGTVLPCEGNHDLYVAKYSPSGALTWIRTAGGSSGDYAHCLAVDNSFVYVGGEVQGSGNKIKFVGSSIALYAKGSNDIVVAKYDLNGNLIWARNDGGVYNEEVLGITYDLAGNVYICGFFTTKASFGSTTITGYGDRDIYVAKYSPSGNFLWAKKAGGSAKDEAKAIKCDAAGNVYICGIFKGSANFNGQTVSSKGNYDMFVAKYTTNGEMQWVKTAGSTWDDAAWGITVDNAGKIFVTGEFNASVKFDAIQLNTTGGGDVFVARYNSSGGVEWAKKAGGTQPDRARAIGTDGSNIFITGQFGGTATFGSITRTAADNSDVFMAAMNNSGSFLWATSAGGAADAPEDLGYESGNAICAGTSGSVYATGAILNGAQFGSTTLNAYSRTDIFITKLKNGSGGNGSEGGGSTGGTELVAAGASWKYLDNGSNQGTAWRTASYSDATWNTGNAELGYGDGGEATIVGYGPNSGAKYITTYFRKSFNIVNTATVTGLELSLLRDDGAVVYINGAEVFRSNMPSGAISYNTLATTAASNESEYTIANISASSLVNGSNVIAVEVHQNAGSSSDLSFNLKLKTLSGGMIEQDNFDTERSAELVELRAEKNENNIDISWNNSGDLTTEYFIIERSIDEENFIPVGFVMQDSIAANRYIFSDKQINQTDSLYPKLFYRINQTDYDGRASYSSSISVSLKEKEEFEHTIFGMYPNPAKNSFTIFASETNNLKYTFSVYDEVGKKVFESAITDNLSKIDISNYSPGIYLVIINSGNKTVFQDKLVVQ